MYQPTSSTRGRAARTFPLWLDRWSWADGIRQVRLKSQLPTGCVAQALRGCQLAVQAFLRYRLVAGLCVGAFTSSAVIKPIVRLSWPNARLLRNVSGAGRPRIGYGPKLSVPRG